MYVCYLNTGPRGYNRETQSQILRANDDDVNVHGFKKKENELGFFDSLWICFNGSDFSVANVVSNGKIVIDATSIEDQATNHSNLDFLLDCIEIKKGEKNIKTLMQRLTHSNFLIGPSSHGYYKNQHTDPSEYKFERMELYHPDIIQGFEPPSGAASMRPF